MGVGVVRQGKASHIHSAASGGPRYDPRQSDSACRSFKNGIWLCDICAREVDDNKLQYPAELLRQWKGETERYVETLVTQDTRLRQLRAMVAEMLSRFRVLSALPGPGPKFDQTFESAGRIPLTRLLIEADQVLFENEFLEEANAINGIYTELETVYDQIKGNAPGEHRDISPWKNATVKTIMLDIMRFSQKSYERYLKMESDMVNREKERLKGSGAQVTQLSPPVTPILPLSNPKSTSMFTACTICTKDEIKLMEKSVKK